jgi:BirA family transcriptional regulator, biotin operon repressor / biotin---[acetyl-CoA-carboxylase] ligase
VDWVAETGSTNADLLAAARDGAPHGTVRVTDLQTAGRGRLGRVWSAPSGSGLLCSVLLRPLRRAVPHGATWAVSLAARRACSAVAGVEPQLKWPNDLLVGERKLAGVLAESVADAGAISAVVVGIGVNVGWTAPPPPEIAERAVTLSEAAGRPVDRDELLRAMLGALAPLVDEWHRDPGALAARYRDALTTLGQSVRVELSDGELHGVATAVTDEGALVLQDGAGDRHVVHVGDVVHLRSDRGGDGSPR